MTESSGPERYHRQQALPMIGPPGQERLGRSRVLVIGCGALGSGLAEMLVRAGVGKLRIVDRDLVELNNLQRQVLFDERDAAQELPKAVAAANRLRQINSTVGVEAMVADVNAGNIEAMLDGEGRMDLIVDGTDNVATRYLINDVAVKQGIGWIYGACVGVEGRVMGIWPGRTACLRCLFPDPPAGNDLPTCDTAGILGPAAVAVAALQAAAAIRFLVAGVDGQEVGAGLMALNVWTGHFHSLVSAKEPREACPCCGLRQFSFLSRGREEFSAALCGRKAVQVMPGGAVQAVDLAQMAQKWHQIGAVQKTPWFVRCRLHEPWGINLTLFPDGRLLVQGTSDPLLAKAIYARFIGS